MMRLIITALLTVLFSLITVVCAQSVLTPTLTLRTQVVNGRFQVILTNNYVQPAIAIEIYTRRADSFGRSLAWGPRYIEPHLNWAYFEPQLDAGYDKPIMPGEARVMDCGNFTEVTSSGAIFDDGKTWGDAVIVQHIINRHREFNRALKDVLAWALKLKSAGNLDRAAMAADLDTMERTRRAATTDKDEFWGYMVVIRQAKSFITRSQTGDSLLPEAMAINDVIDKFQAFSSRLAGDPAMSVSSVTP